MFNYELRITNETVLLIHWHTYLFIHITYNLLLTTGIECQSPASGDVGEAVA